MDNSIERLKRKCYTIGEEMPDKVEHETLMKILAKVIVQEKVLDDDAFEIASEAFTEGFNC